MNAGDEYLDRLYELRQTFKQERKYRTHEATMKVTNCLEVFIRFTIPSLQGVAIRYGMGPTSCHYLRVECDASQLVVRFCDKDGTPRKEIHYNFQHVAEYSCDGWVDADKLKQSL